MKNSKEIGALKEWRELQEFIQNITELLKPIITKEKELRKEIFKTVFDSDKEGKTSFILNGNEKLEATNTVTRKVNEDALKALNDDPEMTEIIKEVINFKPVLKKKEYNHLTMRHRRKIDSALVITPAMPTLKIVKKEKSENESVKNTEINEYFKGLITGNKLYKNITTDKENRLKERGEK